MLNKIIHKLAGSHCSRRGRNKKAVLEYIKEKIFESWASIERSKIKKEDTNYQGKGDKCTNATEQGISTWKFYIKFPLDLREGMIFARLPNLVLYELSYVGRTNIGTIYKSLGVLMHCNNKSKKNTGKFSFFLIIINIIPI